MGAATSSVDVAATSVGGMTRLREDRRLYSYVDMHGGGDLVPWIRYAEKSGDHSIVDSILDVKLREFMYNKGRGKLCTITELVKLRNKAREIYCHYLILLQERNERLSALYRKKGKGKSGPNVLDSFDQEGRNVGDVQKALKLLDGGGKGGGGGSKYREVAWKLEERGSMGETLVGVCILNGSDVHNRIVLKLIDMFPKLVNDISISEDYYGMAPLHQAIVNQDVRMVAILLKKGADVTQRCYGAYFCADDQKGGRTDSLEHEHVDIPVQTNYTGHMYFGEFPLSFAACMNHPDCFRLILAYKDMLRLALEMGASTRITNRQGLTPLTLAAKLAKMRMFLELLDYEGQTHWEYADASNGSYPLWRIDTINQENGDLDDTSALSLAVYGTTKEHLDMFEGLLESLLQAKWDTFAKREWQKSLAFFTFHFIVFFMAYMNRPFSMTTEFITHGLINEKSELVCGVNESDYDDSWSRCHLLRYNDLPFVQGWFRLGCELTVLVLVVMQIIFDVTDIRRIGRTKWINIYKAFPAKIIFKISWVLVLLVVPTRLLCFVDSGFLYADNQISSVAVVLTTVHFLFYCRAIKFIGAFVLMIYTIISTDLKRFILIYSIFMVGFSQSFYMVFYACEYAIDNNENGPLDKSDNTTWESLIRTFIMTIGEFMVFYKVMEGCPQRAIVTIGKVLFLVFEMTVSILQLNLLIAMMTRTYETISATAKEYKRQWAKVILMLEVSIDAEQRKKYLMQYSIPTGTAKEQRSIGYTRKLNLRNLDEHEKEKREKKEKELREQRLMLQKRKKMEAENARERPASRVNRLIPTLHFVEVAKRKTGSYKK